jgi:hypothetical protein
LNLRFYRSAFTVRHQAFSRGHFEYFKSQGCKSNFKPAHSPTFTSLTSVLARHKFKLLIVTARNQLQENKPADAIATLEPAAKYELGSGPGIPSYYAIHLRGEAFLQSKEGVKAAAEFQKILDHRGLWPFSELYPIAQLQLGRALALLGDKAKARVAYQDFFIFSKDADPDIPVLIAAKSEYAKLQ